MKSCKRKDVPIGAVFSVSEKPNTKLLNLGERMVNGELKLTSIFYSGTESGLMHGEKEKDCFLFSSLNDIEIDIEISIPEISYRLFKGDNCDEEASAYINEMLIEGWILERVQTMPEPLFIEVLMKNDARI